MTCKRCLTDPTPPNSSPRNCAFKTEEFSNDNWRCGTLERMREIIGDGYSENVEGPGLFLLRWHDDQSIAVLACDDGKFVILGHYKHRGRVEAAAVLDEYQFRPLTLPEAERILVEEGAAT